MSLLESIKQKKSNLRTTETIITRADGRIFKESKADIQLIGNCHGFVVDTKPDNIPAKITDFIYLGSQDCCDLDVLNKYDIKFILSVGIEAPVRYDHVTYKFVDCLDLPEADLNVCLRECIPFLKFAEQQLCNVLVHCNAGISRSSSVILGYLIKVKGNTYLEALEIVKKARNSAKPNAGFESQLRSLC